MAGVCVDILRCNLPYSPYAFLNLFLVNHGCMAHFYLSLYKNSFGLSLIPVHPGKEAFELS